jgi:hypothetical protein
MKFQDLGKAADKEMAKAKINPYRFGWAVVLLFPIVAFLIDRGFLLKSLGILIAFPIVEYISKSIDNYEGRYGRKSLLHVGIYLDRINAFPVFVMKVVGLFLLSTWFSDLFAAYLTSYSGVITAYLVMAAVFLYYRTTVNGK